MQMNINGEPTSIARILTRLAAQLLPHAPTVRVDLFQAA